MSEEESRKKLREFYNLVKKARERTAGSNVRSIHTVLDNLREALSYAIVWLSEDEHSKNLWGESLENPIREAMVSLAKVKVYGDRLFADNLLCELLNRIRTHEEKQI